MTGVGFILSGYLGGLFGWVVREGVTLVGLTNLPATMPYHASVLYSRNVLALLLHLAPGGELTLDWSDEITAGACVTKKEGVPA